MSEDTRAQGDEEIRLVSYDARWPEAYAVEAAALVATIGDWVTGGIHHVGSTAVPGLAAKPVIDILVGVESLEASAGCVDLLAPLGFAYFPYRAEVMHWFCKPSPAHRTHHLHLVPTDSERFRDELAFRDELRANPGRAREYVALKRDLALRFRHDREAYSQGKTEFVRSTLEPATRRSTEPKP